MASSTKMYNHVRSNVVHTNVQVKISSLCLEAYNLAVTNNLELKYFGLHRKDKLPDLMVKCQLFSGKRTLSLPVWLSLPTNTCDWNEWVKLPLRYSDLSYNTVLAITIFDCVRGKETAICGTAVTLFRENFEFREGITKLIVSHNIIKGSSLSQTYYNNNSKSSKHGNRISYRSKRSVVLPVVHWLDVLTFSELQKKHEENISGCYLNVEFSNFTANGKIYHIVYFDEDSDKVIELDADAEFGRLRDSEIGKKNLILSKKTVFGIPVEYVKPDTTARDKLNNIVIYPTQKLSKSDKDLVWSYRYYLCSQNKTLTLFLKCVDWNIDVQVKEALNMLKIWSPPQVEDALQLLSSTFNHISVRCYAVEKLMSTTDDNLLLYLLQLVQALKYEDLFHKAYSSSLTCNPDGPKLPDLASFLLHRACKNKTLANYLFWYIATECRNLVEQCRATYLEVMKMFFVLIKHSKPEVQRNLDFLNQQAVFMGELIQLMEAVARVSGNRICKIEKLQELLADPKAFKINFSNFEPLPLPLDPNIEVKGIIAEKASLFKSALMPARLTFITTCEQEYVVIFKIGDDLRQDQLILQIITLIDKLLQSENLDLKLTPYKVLTMSPKHGLVQYIDAITVAEVLATEGTIQNFFRKYHPCETGPYGLALDIMDTYVKSCAGYCVITYILGVGDRHLDNLLLTRSGRLFHIDFGYILGQDPKLFPTPMKLTIEMVEAMGGMHSDHYIKFKKLSSIAFLCLRCHANLILNLFSLMANSSIFDIGLEPETAMKNIQDKLMIDKGDEEAVLYLHNLLDESANALMAVIEERLHRLAQLTLN